MHSNRFAAAKLRSNMIHFPAAHYGVINYTIEDAIANDSYGILQALDSLYKQRKEISFLDVGANFGVVSLGVRAMLPEANIVAVEPFHSTFAELVKTTAGQGIQCVHHAMGDGGNISFKACNDPLCVTGDKNVGMNAVYAATLSCMLKQYDIGRSVVDGSKHPFIVKIDCEGGESALLRSQHETKFLLERLRDHQGFVGLEIHWGKKYWHCGEDVVTSAEWDAWLSSIPSNLKPTRKDITPTTGIITFGAI